MLAYQPLRSPSCSAVFVSVESRQPSTPRLRARAARVEITPKKAT